MADRFAGYDVLAKRGTPSWDAPTRNVIDERLAFEVPPGVLSETQLATLRMLISRVCPDPSGRPPTTTLAMIVRRIAADERDGYRHHRLPPTAQCWRRALGAIEAEARERYGAAFAALDDETTDLVLSALARGDVVAAAWDRLPPRLVWQWRLLPDIVSAHWAQPALWSAMGFGGPASPRGYVRLGVNRRDPWEAIETGASLEGLPRHRE